MKNILIKEALEKGNDTPETIESFHIIPFRPSEDFIPETFKIKTLTKQDGVYPLVGNITEIKNEPPCLCKYIFDSDKWTLDNAIKWVKESGKNIDYFLGNDDEIIDFSDKGGKSRMKGKHYKIYDCEIKDINEKERTFTAIASTEDVDRDGDILRADGWKLKNYLKNPVGLWGHNSSIPAIFKTLEVEIKGKKLIFKPQFAPAEVHPLADQIFQLYKLKFLKAFSVRFDPYKWEDIPQKTEPRPGERVRYGRDYKSQDLMEISCCNVPANPACLSSKEYRDMIVKDNQLQNLHLINDSQAMQNTKMECGIKCCKDTEYCNKSCCHCIDGNQVDEEKELTEKYGDVIEMEDVLKPFEDEHSCRLQDPGKYKTCRRTERSTGGKKYSVITCQLKVDAAKWEEQAYRYDKKIWEEAQAKKHCKDHDGIKFEPAKKSDEPVQDTNKKGKGLTVPLKIDVDITGLEKTQAMLEMLKTGRVLSAKNRTIVKNTVVALTTTLGALNELLEATEAPRSSEEIINELKGELEDEKNKDKKLLIESVKELLDVMKKNETVLSSLQPKREVIDHVD